MENANHVGLNRSVSTHGAVQSGNREEHSLSYNREYPYYLARCVG